MSVSAYHPAQHMGRAVLRKCLSNLIDSEQSHESNCCEIKYGTLTVMELNYNHIILYFSLNSKAPPIYSEELVNKYFPSDISISPFSNSLCSLNFCFSFSNTLVIIHISYYTLTFKI